MASAVGVAYQTHNKTTDDNHSVSRSLGEECSFVSSGLRKNKNHNKADTGILGCTVDHICVEGSRSYLGGRCIPVDTAHQDLHRDLYSGTDDDDSCTKCAGRAACKGLTQDFIDNNIGEGSCCGKGACYGLSGK